MDLFNFRGSTAIKVHFFHTHYSGSYLLNILFLKKSKAAFERTVDFLASEYISESMSIADFLIKYKFSSVATEVNYNKKWWGAGVEKRTEFQEKWKQRTEIFLDRHIIATKLSTIHLLRTILYFHLSQQMHIFNNVGIQQKEHLKVIQAQLDANSIPAFYINPEYPLRAHTQKGTGNFIQDPKKLEVFFSVFITF